MNDSSPASFLDKGGPSSTKRGGSLSIFTSKPRPNDAVTSAQSPKSSSALPHPSPHRTFSGPAALPSPSLNDVLDEKSRSPITPQSASTRLKLLRFEKGDDALNKSRTTPAGGSKKRDDVKRRHSEDPRMNVHTKCGRNSDDWLFSGWNVKKIWDGKETGSQSGSDK